MAVKPQLEVKKMNVNLGYDERALTYHRRVDDMHH